MITFARSNEKQYRYIYFNHNHFKL